MDEYLTYHKNSLSKLQQTYSNICSQLNIEHFGYARIYNDSSYYFLCNDEKIPAEYAHNVRSSNIFLIHF